MQATPNHPRLLLFLFSMLAEVVGRVQQPKRDQKGPAVGASGKTHLAIRVSQGEPTRKRLPLLWFWKLSGSIVERASVFQLCCLSLAARWTARIYTQQSGKFNNLDSGHSFNNFRSGEGLQVYEKPF